MVVILFIAAALHVLLIALLAREQQHGPKSSALEEAADAVIRRDVLPAFATDFSEVFMSSLIERVVDSDALVLTTFVLCHYTLEPQQLSKWNTLVDPSKAKEWRTVLTHPERKLVHYLPSGQRRDVPGALWSCRVRNAEGRRQYQSEGIFMPNRMTKDSNANRRMDVFRCALEDVDSAYSALVRSPTAALYVEILRRDSVLISFSVPWDSRRTGYLLSSPDLASRFDAWSDRRNIFLCSPGFEFDYQARLTRGVKPGIATHLQTR